MKRFSGFIILLCFFGLGISKAQTNDPDISIKGVVVDGKTGETMPFVNIYIPQAGYGYQSDIDGFFNFIVPAETDSMIFSFIGYKNEKVKKFRFKSDSMVIKMEPESVQLTEFTVKAPKKVKEKDTIAMRLFRNVMAEKDNNKPKSYDSYQFEEYSKSVASLFNIKPSLKDRKIVKPFRFIFENQDTTPSGSHFVPLILKETISDNYYQKDPKKSKQVLKASKVSGIEQLRFSDLLDIAFDDLDIYGNQLLVNGKGFQLPFSDGALLNYKYLFLDSAKGTDSNWVYRMAFVPKSKGDLAFTGTSWIHSPDWAIQKIQLDIDKRANLNFVNDFSLEQEFEYFEGQGWFRTKESRSTGMAFTKRKKSKSVRLYRLTSRKNIQLNQPINDSIFAGDAVTYEKDYRRKNDQYWDSLRHDTLNTHESHVYGLIDSLKNTKAYKIYSGIGRFFASGYYRAGPIDIGNLYQLVSWNDLEGVRLRLNVKSNSKLSEWYRFEAYGAYGTSDKKWKYGAEFSSRIPSKRQRSQSIGISYYDDYQRFSLEGSNLNYDYIYNSILRKSSISDLVYVRDATLRYSRQLAKDFSGDFYLQYRSFQTIPGKVEFIKTNDDSTVTVYDKFQVFTPKINLNITPGAKFFAFGKRSILLKGNLPRIFITYQFSNHNLLGSDFDFQKLDLKIQHSFHTPIGYTKYWITASKLFGSAPYPLLTSHPGNESFLVEFQRFGMMGEASYIADQQVSLFFEHHFEGFFFNKIPGFRKLQLREVFITKMAVSSLSPEKVSFIDIPEGMSGLNGYYAEVGFGIENILKILRVDFMWRLTQKDQGLDKFKVFLAFQPNF